MTSVTCTGCQHAFEENALFCPNCGRPKVRQAGTDPLVGKLLGERFQVLELIGQGGSGTIYKAEHVTLRRRVAIKVLHDELSRDDLAVERFRREATTVAEIDNEHIVEIHDFGRTPDGRLYLAMELLEGETLDTILARDKQLSVERTADILIQVGEALMEAHAIGYVHRDLRPRNIYLANRRGKTNFIKLLDFGLAKLVETEGNAASTSLGMTFGDPRYMSPEQARGDGIDRRADIYQLGCVAYEMLTGSPPFTGNRVFDILTKQVSEVPQPLPTRRPGVPLWMEAAAAKMLAKDPENRFATTTRMVEALRRGLETGEVMDDEIARRRESVPPPSVSRVMQKMGLTPGNLPIDPTQTVKGLPPVPSPPAVPDSVELLRKRTGTPQLGVPVAASAALTRPTEAAGTIDPPRRDHPESVRRPEGARPHRRDSEEVRRDESRREESRREESRREESRRDEPRRRRDSEADDSSSHRRADSELPRRADRDSVVERPRRPSTAVPAGRKRPTVEPGISQVWYDEGESDAAATRARKTISPSTTDLNLYDDVPRKRRGGLIAAVIGVAVIGGVAFALSRGGGDSKTLGSNEPLAVSSIDAGPSTILTPEPDASLAAVDAAASVKPSGGRSSGTTTSGAINGTRPFDTGPIDVGRFVLGGTGSATTVTIIPPKDPPKDPNAGSGSGINGGPQDPYGGGGSDAPDPGTPGSAQQFATQGMQQLSNGDLTNAAQSFKKALELDPNNAMATIGMGDIASRQGLWGDAIAHLTKAAKLSPRNAMVWTLLGEAYLRTSNPKQAAQSFKTALQLDPNNSRARDGYNEASAKEPPPTDD